MCCSVCGRVFVGVSGDPVPAFAQLEPAVSVLSRLLSLASDEEVLIELCKALSCLTDASGWQHLQLSSLVALRERATVRHLIELLDHTSVELQELALHTLANLVDIDPDVQVQAVLECGVLPSLRTLLMGSAGGLCMDACNLLSYLAAAGTARIQLVLDADLIQPLVVIVHDEGKGIEAQVAALHAVHHAICSGSKQQIWTMAQQGVLPPLCSILSWDIDKIARMALECLNSILSAGGDVSVDANVLEGGDAGRPYAQQVRQCGGLAALEKLLQHKDPHIAAEARRIRDSFFGRGSREEETEEEEEEEAHDEEDAMQ